MRAAARALAVATAAATLMSATLTSTALARKAPPPMPATTASWGPADGLAEGLTLSDLARSNDGPYERYRIPALTVMPNGNLLAVYDGRPAMNDLPSNISVMGRISTDQGQTWGEPMTIRSSAAPEGHGDPSVVVDRVTGDIFAFYASTVNAGYASSTTGSDPDDPNVMHADYSRSSDNGATWTHHRITADLKAGHTDWAGLFAASGEGIQIRRGTYAGRLVQQFTVRANGQNYAFSALSDDHGNTWRSGGLAGPGADENKTVELADGRLLLVSRAAPFRNIATSSDGGQTWTSFSQDNELPDPANNGAIIRAYPDAPASDPRSQILLHINTDNQFVRRNLTVRMSCDSGATWPVSKAIQTGASAYSTITALPAADGTLGGSYGVLYERDGYSYLSYTSFDLAWLGGVCASLSVGATGPFTPGVARSIPVTVTNQTGGTLAAGTLGIPSDSAWKATPVQVGSLAPGARTTVQVSVTAPTTADPRNHQVPIQFSNGTGSSRVMASLPVSGNFTPAPTLTVSPVLDAIYTDSQPGFIGDRIQPWVLVTNTGNVALTEISFSAPAGATSCNVASLAPGATTACRNNSPSHIVTAADIAAGSWTTTYRVSASYNGQTVSSSAELFPVTLW